MPITENMIEQKFEQLLFAMRWLLAPIYFGLSLALIALVIKFFQELFHVFPHILVLAEADLVLTVLALVDIALVGSLIIMVMLKRIIIQRLDITRSPCPSYRACEHMSMTRYPDSKTGLNSYFSWIPDTLTSRSCASMRPRHTVHPVHIRVPE